MRLFATMVSIGLILFTGALSSWSAESAPVITNTLDLRICEDFESGYTLGSELRDHPDWFFDSGHSGPIPTAGIGVAGSIGLSTGNAAFSWLTQGFNWNDPTPTGVNTQMDYQKLTSYDSYEARNPLSPPLDKVVAATTGHIMARRVGTMVSVDFRVNFKDPTPLMVIRRVGDSSETRTWGVGDFSSIQESSTGLFLSLRDFDLVGFPRQYTLVYRDGGGEVTLDQAKVELPPALELKMTAFPNPFNPRVEIKFTIPKPAQTRLDIFDSRGHLVQSLVSEVKSAGEESVFWTGEDSRGRPVASGVYHLRLVVDQQRITKSVTLVR